MEKTLRDNLMSLARAYAKARGVALTTVSRQIHGNVNFLNDYGNDYISITVSKYAEMVAEMRADWPHGSPRPRMKTVRI